MTYSSEDIASALERLAEAADEHPDACTLGVWQRWIYERLAYELDERVIANGSREHEGDPIESYDVADALRAYKAAVEEDELQLLDLTEWSEAAARAIEPCT